MTDRFGASVCVSAVLLFVMAWPSATLGQPTTAAIAGVVLDARTRRPLAGALVELRNPPQSVASDVEGRFRFENVPIGSRELAVSRVGYALAKYDLQVPPEGLDVTILVNEGAAAYNETVTVEGSLFGVREVEFAELVGRRGGAGLRPERATLLDVGMEGRVGATARWQVTPARGSTAISTNGTR